jgi:hypothetical protein
MTNRDTKEVVVIRNINSNIIEEAILILKDRPEDSANKASNQKKTVRGVDKEYILKEAQAVIDTYIKEHNLEIKPIRGKDRKIRIFKRYFSFGAIINIALALGILSLVFFISRLL